jgi:hypothetical protein
VWWRGERLSVEVEELKKRTCRLGKTLTVLGANTPGTMRICTEQRQQDFSMTYIQDEFSLLGQLHLVAYDSSIQCSSPYTLLGCTHGVQPFRITPMRKPPSCTKYSRPRSCKAAKATYTVEDELQRLLFKYSMVVVIGMDKLFLN